MVIHTNSNISINIPLVDSMTRISEISSSSRNTSPPLTPTNTPHIVTFRDELTNGHFPKPIIRKSSSSGKLAQRRGSESNSCTSCGHNSQHPLPISPLAIQHTPKTMDDNKHALLTGKSNGNMPRNDSSVSINPHPLEFATSRRPSVMLQDILHARRPSQLLAAFRGKHSKGNIQDHEGHEDHRGTHSSSRRESLYPEQAQHSKMKNRRMGDDAITRGLSALYCKFLVILGVVMPVTEIISEKIPTVVYQSFYVYMYGGSILFVVFVYSMTFKNRALFNIVKNYHAKENNLHMKRKAHRFGSFYLRVGAISFAIGNMVYSGLEFGQFFELNGSPGCRDPFVAITPIMRMILCIIQVQFIFLNTKDLDMGRHKVISRFGLMHMVATNLCEWLYVLVEETKHEIFHFSHHSDDHQVANNHSSTGNSTDEFMPLGHHLDGCTRTNIMGALVQEVSPFLFPCTIEYSLICAVILYEMWKTIKSIPDIDKERKYSLKSAAEHQHKGSHHFSVDCSQAHRGLFFGILVIVMTIISMIMYFVLYDTPGLRDVATREVTIWEISMFAMCSAAIITAMILMRDLKFVKDSDSHHSMALDCNLLILAQTGVYLYALFSIMGAYYSTIENRPDRIECIIDEVFGLFQTSIQTLFILNACQRRCKGQQQIRKKPGRDFITFLLVANVSMWFINTLIKGRATFRSGQMEFFGIWAWTIITHTSMPLAIFYRFHSTVCFFEIWKVTYKAKAH
ncbi:hypothetical protein ACFFRR_003346 [Megaselia abdita]